MTDDDQKPVDTVEQLCAELFDSFRRALDGFEAQGAGRAPAAACMFRAAVAILEHELTPEDAAELTHQAHEYARSRAALARAEPGGSA